MNRSLTEGRIGALFVIAVLLWLARVIALIFDTPWVAFTATGIIFAVLALVNITLLSGTGNNGTSIAVFALAIGVVVMDAVLGQLSSARRIAAIFVHLVLGAVIVGLVIKLQAEPPKKAAIPQTTGALEILPKVLGITDVFKSATIVLEINSTYKKSVESKIIDELNKVLTDNSALETLTLRHFYTLNSLFGKTSQLKSLDLQFNNLTLDTFPLLIAPQLTTLNLQNNNNLALDENFADFLIKRFPLLSGLEISAMRYGETKTAQFRKMLPDRVKITTLRANH